MKLPIVKYGHPSLRKKGAPVKSFTPELRQLVSDMLDTMEAARGVGLAAQQIGQALQLTVIDVTDVTDRPSRLFIDDKEVPLEPHMPLVLANPVVTPLNDPVAGPEGCLSFPELYADISRPESVHVRAFNEHGVPYEFRAGGLLARAVQHEVDHLNGILFIDRMTSSQRQELKPELQALQANTKKQLAQK